MRHIAAPFVLGVLLANSVGAEPMKPADRQRLLTHLEMTESWLASEIDGLTPAQLAFQMAPESWSIAQVVEHLAIAEPQYWAQVQASLKEPAAPQNGDVTDADILWYGIDRTQRSKTGDARVPTGKYKDAGAALAEFRKLRAEIREFANSTQADLRGRPAQGRQHAALPMGAHDLDARSASHPADSRD
ncbi:MAG TPA: DinB family protein [Vicinamibacterales bacterium]|nr:DinB family protein [Vicinamibacterales bacterium]